MNFYTNELSDQKFRFSQFSENLLKFEEKKNITNCEHEIFLPIDPNFNSSKEAVLLSVLEI